VDQDSVAAAFQQNQEGEGSPLPTDDALIRLRRESDWTRQPRKGDEAAAAAYRAALEMATATLAAHDGGTAAHSDDVTTLCIALAEELGVQGRDRAYLLAAAELHDIGKVTVDSNILSKPAPLDPREWEVIRAHTVAGERILGAVPELAEVARIVRQCHERWDGTGYPDGLKGEQIPLAARIVFCADAFHAIRGDRPYRRGRSARVALEEVRRNSGTQFDPAVVDALAATALRVREKRHRGFATAMGGRRSQRLVALLLALTIGGAAMAATGVWGPRGGAARAEGREGARPGGGFEPGDTRIAGRAAQGRPGRADATRSPARPAPAGQGGRRALARTLPGAAREAATRIGLSPDGGSGPPKPPDTPASGVPPGGPIRPPVVRVPSLGPSPTGPPAQAPQAPSPALPTLPEVPALPVPSVPAIPTPVTPPSGLVPGR